MVTGLNRHGLSIGEVKSQLLGRIRWRLPDFGETLRIGRNVALARYRDGELAEGKTDGRGEGPVDHHWLAPEVLLGDEGVLTVKFFEDASRELVMIQQTSLSE